MSSMTDADFREWVVVRLTDMQEMLEEIKEKLDKASH